jgi:hypothetical protein
MEAVKAGHTREWGLLLRIERKLVEHAVDRCSVGFAVRAALQQHP